MGDGSFLFTQFLGGLTTAMFLFLIASGLSLVFGVMRVLNFAHGSFYMLGAYLAWQAATKNQNLQPIDGFTPDQRFFIGMAQWACGDERPENKRLNAITNPHPPNEYRINGVVSDMPQFQKAFSCKAGQPMVRTQQCRVW